MTTAFSSAQAPTNVRGHLPERSWPNGADGSERIVGRLVQVGHAGSQALAQSVVRAGVAAVAIPGQLRHGRTAGRLRHAAIPAEGQYSFYVMSYVKINAV